MKHITIVCDGSSLGNGKGETRAAAVAILEYRGVRKIVGEYLGNCTNQQAEVVAACLGLEALKEPCEVKVISDSQYVVQTMSGKFKRKANHDFWERLDRAAKPHRVKWEWTRGHAGHEIQEICDTAARTIATRGKLDQEEIDRLLSGDSKVPAKS